MTITTEYAAARKHCNQVDAWARPIREAYVAMDPTITDDDFQRAVDAMEAAAQRFDVAFAAMQDLPEGDDSAETDDQLSLI